MQHDESRIWNTLNNIRSQGTPSDLHRYIKELAVEGVSPDVLQRIITQQSGPEFNSCPAFIADFVGSYLQDTPLEAVLDVWAGTGSMLAPVIERCNPKVAIAVNRNAEVHELGKALDADERVQWEKSNPFVFLNEFEGSFDAVVGCLPFHSQDMAIALSTNGSETQLQDRMSSLLLTKASTMLKADGTGFFVVAPDFFSKRSPKSAYANMSRLGLFIDAALSVPGPFSRNTGLLLIVKKTKPEYLFVGELDSVSESSSVLLDNLQRRKAGKTIQLGTLVEPDSFTSFPALVAQHDLKRMGRLLGVQPTPLAEIATELNLASRNREDGFDDKANAVYLPLIGFSPAVTTLADFRIKPHNYIQIIVNPQKAIPAFVANSFNTPLGQKMRESISSGVIPKISKLRLADTLVYLPDMDAQTETLRVQSAITDLSTQLEEYQRQIWRQPRDAAKVHKKLKSLNREDGFESWIESLPFPLASVLRSYHAENDPASQVNHLLNFFEALSQFVCTVLLSGVRNDSALSERITQKVGGSDPSNQEWLRRSTFGGWNRFGEQLAKEVRRLLSNNETRRRCLDSFGSPNDDLLNSLTNKNLFAILKEVKDKRDRWKGHGGIVGDQESKRRRTLLQSDLSNVMQLIADSYNSTQLIQPDNAQIKEGIFHWQVKLLMGANPIFRKIGVQTTGPMETGKLYLLNVDQYKPIKLLPFFRLMESPRTQQNALYFYNRVEGADVRWVSYHFDTEAEIYSRDDEVVSALSLLNPSDNRSRD